MRRFLHALRLVEMTEQGDARNDRGWMLEMTEGGCFGMTGREDARNDMERSVCHLVQKQD